MSNTPRSGVFDTSTYQQYFTVKSHSRRFAWCKATNDQINAYSDLLSEAPASVLLLVNALLYVEMPNVMTSITLTESIITVLSHINVVSSPALQLFQYLLPDTVTMRSLVGMTSFARPERNLCSGTAYGQMLANRAVVFWWILCVLRNVNIIMQFVNYIGTRNSVRNRSLLKIF